MILKCGSLAIVVDFEPGCSVALDSLAGVRITELGVGRRPAAGIGIAQNQTAEIPTSVLGAFARYPSETIVTLVGVSPWLSGACLSFMQSPEKKVCET
jgi:hypothetical protein